GFHLCSKYIPMKYPRCAGLECKMFHRKMSAGDFQRKSAERAPDLNTTRIRSVRAARRERLQTHTHTHTPPHQHTHTHKHILTFTHTHTHTHINTHKHYTHTNTHTQAHINKHSQRDNSCKQG